MLEVTIANVSELLATIGCNSIHQERGAGWHRVYILVPQEDGIPLQIGRVMFQNGKFKWVHWYCPPVNGDLQEGDRFYFDWYLLLAKNKRLGEASWQRLKDRATQKAEVETAFRKALRRELNSDRVANGKMPRTKPIAPPNQRRAALKLFSEYLRTTSSVELDL